MLKQFRTLAELNDAFREPQAAIDHFRAIRWKHGEFCPHCGHDKVYTLKRKNIYRCAECRTNFSITVGTIFENSKLPLKVWFGAIWLITNHKKGIASTTLAIDLGITQKSAWFLLHRLRHAARTRSFNAPRRFRGKVEVDETYVGGKSINRHGRRSGIGGGHGEKTPVVGAVERNGDVVARVVPVASQPELQAFIHEVVSPRAEMLVTDAHPAYTTLEGFPQHRVVNHQKGQWRKGDAHTNSIESIWALLKRQIIGIHHYVSPKHLAKYVDEMTWRLNNRALTAEDRVNALFSAVEGRLTYKALIGKA
jgi:transposase-like protein